MEFINFIIFSGAFPAVTFETALSGTGPLGIQWASPQNELQFNTHHRQHT